jgi:heme-degrading monooxygenase HmoA
VDGPFYPEKMGDKEAGNMIGRIWHGWTTSANADAYEALLKDEIFLSIKNRRISGFRGIQLFRRNLKDDVEFVTIMCFENLDAVRAFAGNDYEAAVVPPKAKKLLSRFDRRSQHYDIRVEMKA